MAIADLAEELEGLIAVAGEKGFCHLFQGIRGLAHGGYDYEQLLVLVGAQEDRELTDTFYAIDAGTPEFKNFIHFHNVFSMVFMNAPHFVAQI